MSATTDAPVCARECERVCAKDPSGHQIECTCVRGREPVFSVTTVTQYRRDHLVGGAQQEGQRGHHFRKVTMPENPHKVARYPNTSQTASLP